MKLLFDENLSPRLVSLVQELYPGSAHVHEVGLGTAHDHQIWDLAMTNHLVIVTKDADFAERSVLEPDAPKILWLRIGNCRTDEIERLLRTHYDVIRTFAERDAETCLLLQRV